MRMESNRLWNPTEWLDSVASSRAADRPQSAPTRHRPPRSPAKSVHLYSAAKSRILVGNSSNNKPRESRPSSSAHRNPYETPFPRARIWNANDLAGLSGERAPPDWDTNYEPEAARVAEAKGDRLSAKKLYVQLVKAVACTHSFRVNSLARGNDDGALERTLEQREELALLGEPQQQQRLDVSSEEEAAAMSARRGTSDTLENKLYEVTPRGTGSTVLQNYAMQELPSFCARSKGASKDEGFAGYMNDNVLANSIEPRKNVPVGSPRGASANQEASHEPGIVSLAPTAPAIPPPASPCPRPLSASLCHAPGEETEAIKAINTSSTSFESSSGSSVSSAGSCDSANTAVVLGDFTASADGWLDDVHGAGRQAFFELFKRDITPQFSRPALSLLGRNGIGADFIDGEPNIKYMPQKPVQLRDSLWSQSQACMNEIVPETPSPYPKRPLSSSFPRSGATEAQTLEDGQAYRRGPPVTRKSRGDGTPSDRRPSSTPRLAPDPICGRPQSSKAIGGRMVRSQRDSPTENHTDSAFAGEVWQAARELRPRQKTANGREVQLPRFCVPHLDDPADPAMIANRMAKRPLSPRRDYLMRCAERQLMPVPVVNSALKIEARTASRDHLLDDSEAADHDPSDVNFVSQAITGKEECAKGHGREASLVLRHYYLGSARINCLESIIKTLPVALREVELVDAGLDEVASEVLFQMLLGRTSTITKLDLSRNSIGVRGATSMARYVAQKGCALQSLKLDGNKTGDEAMITVLKALFKHQPPLTHLGISDNRLTRTTLEECAGPLLTGGPLIRCLNLGWNRLNKRAAQEFADALAWNKSITTVNLEFNNFGDGVHYLASALQNNRSITSLDLSANQVRWRGAIALSEAISANLAIQKLLIRDNPIGTAAALHLAMVLARKPGPPCKVDIKGCACFSDKVDFWSGLMARARATRAARLAAKRKRNRATVRRKNLKGAAKKSNRASAVAKTVTEGKKRGKGEAVSTPQRATPQVLTRPTDPDEQLYWLNLRTHRTMELRLERPFDRAVGVEVLRAFNFSTGGGLAGVLKKTGEAPRRVFFRRRGDLRDIAGAGDTVPAGSTMNGRADNGRQVTITRATEGRDKSFDSRKRVTNYTRHTTPKGLPGANHSLTCWLNEWSQCKERGWEGDVTPVAGLSPEEEARRLLNQLPEQGTLKLDYKPGTPLSSKLSLQVGDFTSEPEDPSHNPQQTRVGEVSWKKRNTVEEKDAGSSDGCVGELPDADGGPWACGAGFHSLIYLLRSLASPVQMCQMVECLSRRSWLSDAQISAILGAFSDEPKMSEPRCRTFLALIPNIRHNDLKILARGLAPRLKRLQGIPPPDHAKETKQTPAKGRARIVTATLGATSGRVQAAHSMTGKQAALKVGFKTAEQINCKEGAEIDEEDSGRCRRRVLEGGWKEGRFFDNVDVEAIAGCAASAFRRFGVEGLLTRSEEASLGAALENLAYFNPFAPTGHYNLNMNLAGERDVFRAILRLDKVNRAYAGTNGLMDPSQHGNGHYLRNFKLGGGRPFKFGLLSRRARKKIKKRNAARKPHKRIARTEKDTTVKRPPAKEAKYRQRSNPRDMVRSPKVHSKVRAKTQPREGALPGTGKRYPTIPTVSRISFDFLHNIRPPPGVNAISREGFGQFLRLLTWDDDVITDKTITPKRRGRLQINHLRSLNHALYFSCQQVVELLQIFPGEDDMPAAEDSLEPHASGGGSSYREEAFITVFSQITDESNLDLCLGMLTNSEVSRCEARLGLVALFMPTQPEGRYKLDLRGFEERQIVNLLLGLERADPSLKLLGMRHDGKFLEAGSWPFESTPDIPARGRFRTRVVTRRAFKTERQLALGEAARWRMARHQLGWHESPPPPKHIVDSVAGKGRRIEITEADATIVIKMARSEERIEDPRPRKRAIVRNHKKQSTPEDAEREVKAPRMRRRSFSHFPCLHDDSLTAFLPPAVGNQGVPGMAQVSFPHISQACKKPRSRGATAIYAGKENQKVRGVNVEVLRTRDVVEVPAVESTGERAGMSRGRLRRWPSSADIGMVTDGR